MAGITLGISAWGLVTGVAMIKSGLDIPLALLMSLVVFAGSSTTPGVGVPMVLISGRLAAERVGGVVAPEPLVVEHPRHLVVDQHRVPFTLLARADEVHDETMQLMHMPRELVNEAQKNAASLKEMSGKIAGAIRQLAEANGKAAARASAARWRAVCFWGL